MGSEQSNPPNSRSPINEPDDHRSKIQRSGFTEGLLQLSHAIWIISYPIVMPFAANRQVSEIKGVGGQGGSGVRYLSSRR